MTCITEKSAGEILTLGFYSVTGFMKNNKTAILTHAFIRGYCCVQNLRYS